MQDGIAEPLRRQTSGVAALRALLQEHFELLSGAAASGWTHYTSELSHWSAAAADAGVDPRTRDMAWQIKRATSMSRVDLRAAVRAAKHLARNQHVVVLFDPPHWRTPDTWTFDLLPALPPHHALRRRTLEMPLPERRTFWFVAASCDRAMPGQIRQDEAPPTEPSWTSRGALTLNRSGVARVPLGRVLGWLRRWWHDRHTQRVRHALQLAERCGPLEAPGRQVTHGPRRLRGPNFGSPTLVGSVSGVPAI